MASKCVVCHDRSEGRTLMPGLPVCNDCKAKPSHVAMAAPLRSEIETWVQERYGPQLWMLARWLGPFALVVLALVVVLRVWVQYQSGPTNVLLGLLSALPLTLAVALFGYYAYGKLASEAADALGIPDRPPLLQASTPPATDYDQP